MFEEITEQLRCLLVGCRHLVAVTDVDRSCRQCAVPSGRIVATTGDGAVATTSGGAVVRSMTLATRVRFCQHGAQAKSLVLQTPLHVQASAPSGCPRPANPTRYDCSLLHSRPVMIGWSISSRPSSEMHE